MKKFDIAIPSAKELYNVAKVLDYYCYDVSVKVSENGLELYQLSDDRVVLFNLFIPQRVFTRKNIGEETELVILTEHLKKVLSYARRGDDVRLRVDDRSLVLSLVGSYTREFRIPLQDEEPLRFDVPELPFTAKAVVVGYALKDIVRIMDWNDDPKKTIKLEMSGGKVIFETHSDEKLSSIGSRVVLTLEDEPLLDIDIEDDTISYYGNEYLKSIVKPAKRDSEVLLKMVEDGPLSVAIPLMGDEGWFKALLAPRVVD